MRSMILPLALLTLACNTDGAGPNNFGPPTVEPGPPALAKIIAGDAQTATVAEPLPIQLEAQVVDTAGRAVPGAVVSWAGDGEVFAAATESDSNGMVSNDWTLDEVAGPQTMDARWINPETQDRVVLAVFEATGEPGAPVSLAFTEDRVWRLYDGPDGERKVAPRRLLEAADQYTNEIDPARLDLTIETPETMTVEADSVRASRETRGWIRASVGELSDSLEVAFLRDLRPYVWTVEWDCPAHDGRVVSDSVAYQPVDLHGRTSGPAIAPLLMYVSGYAAGTPSSWGPGMPPPPDTTRIEDREYALNQDPDALVNVGTLGGWQGQFMAQRGAGDPPVYSATSNAVCWEGLEGSITLTASEPKAES